MSYLYIIRDKIRKHITPIGDGNQKSLYHYDTALIELQNDEIVDNKEKRIYKRKTRYSFK